MHGTMVFLKRGKDLTDKCIFNFPIKHEYKPVIRNIKLDINPSKDQYQPYSEYKKSIITFY